MEEETNELGESKFRTRMMQLFGKPRRTVVVLWTVLAAVNLSAALVIAAWPERQVELDEVLRWVREWLIDGVNVYAPAEGRYALYPPHGIVVLAPLGLVPRDIAVQGWAALNLTLAILVPCLAVKAVQPSARLSEARLPILMFLCWGGVRTLLQISLLSLMLGLVAMVLADRRPRWAGVCLGLALLKPQMSLPVLLWALFTRRLRLVAVAGTVVAAGFSLYCLRAQTTPAQVLVRYVEILRLVYGREGPLSGLANIHPLLSLTTLSAHAVEMLWLVIAVALLLVVCVLGVREGRRGQGPLYGAPALAGFWSLLTLYHLTYGFVVLVPALMLLVFDPDPETAGFRRRLVWALQIALMIDIPGLWWRVGPFPSIPGILNAGAPHADRILMLTFFICVATLSFRASVDRRGAGQPAPSLTSSRTRSHPCL